MSKQQYWSEITTKIYTELDLSGQYICVWNPYDIALDGNFDLDALETIVRIVKEAKESEPK